MGFIMIYVALISLFLTVFISVRTLYAIKMADVDTDANDIIPLASFATSVAWTITVALFYFA